MNIIKILLLLMLLFSCNLQKRNEFDNKYLIYSYNEKKENEVFFNDYFIAIFDDTVFEVQESFGYRHKYPGYTLPHQASDVYKIKKRKDGIYFQYYWLGTIKELKRYPLKLYDTIKHSMFTDSNYSITNFDFSTYTGIDTLMLFNGKLRKCRKFVEKLYCSNGRYYQERYLDNKTQLPLMINYLYYDIFDTLSKTTILLRFLLDKTEVKSKEFRYPNSFDKPIDYNNDMDWKVPDSIIFSR